MLSLSPNAIAALSLRRFTDSDWEGLAGAESFPDGTAPFIGQIKFIESPDPWLVVVDAASVGLIGDLRELTYHPGSEALLSLLQIDRNRENLAGRVELLALLVTEYGMFGSVPSLALVEKLEWTIRGFGPTVPE